MIQQHIITPVEKLVRKALDDKIITPMDLSYPGFAISKEEAIRWFSNLVQTRVNINYEFVYNSKSFLGAGEHEFSELVKLDEKIKAGGKNLSAQESKLKLVLERLLPTELDKDANLSKKNLPNLFKESFTFGLSHHIKATLMDIESLKTGPVNESYAQDRKQLVANLCATLIFLRENNPSVFKQMQKEIEHNPLQDNAKEVLQEINSPSDMTLLALYHFDRKFAKQHYPKEIMPFVELDVISNRFHKLK